MNLLRVGLPWNQLIPRGSWRAQLLPDVMRMVRRGLPGTQIIRTLQREHGRAYRRQDVYRDVRRFSDAIVREERLRAAEGAEPIPIEAHVEVVDKVPTRFTYVVHAWGRDPETGRFKAATYTLRADHAQSPETLRASTERLLSEGESARLGRLILRDMRIEEARVNPEAW